MPRHDLTLKTNGSSAQTIIAVYFKAGFNLEN
jgi:hypothetical protein